MTRGSVKVGVVQHACSADRDANVALASRLVREAATVGAQVICLPELFAGPYFCQTQESKYFDLAEPADGRLVSEMQALASELGVTLLAGFFEARAPGLYHNSLAVCVPNLAAPVIYRKMHIPQDPQFEEKFYFAPGDLGFKAVPTPECIVGPLVCWDQWYPEAARLTALLGAQLLFYPTAIGWLPAEKSEYGAEQLDAWRTIQRSHAIANGVFTVAVNRVGVETSAAGEIEFWGNSFVCDPGGKVLAQAGTSQEVLVVECDLGKVAETRRTWPFLRDRRIDAYAGLTERFGK